MGCCFSSTEDDDAHHSSSNRMGYGSIPSASAGQQSHNHPLFHRDETRFQNGSRLSTSARELSASRESQRQPPNSLKSSLRVLPLPAQQPPVTIKKSQLGSSTKVSTSLVINNRPSFPNLNGHQSKSGLPTHSLVESRVADQESKLHLPHQSDNDNQPKTLPIIANVKILMAGQQTHQQDCNGYQHILEGISTPNVKDSFVVGQESHQDISDLSLSNDTPEKPHSEVIKKTSEQPLSENKNGDNSRSINPTRVWRKRLRKARRKLSTLPSALNQDDYESEPLIPVSKAPSLPTLKANYWDSVDFIHEKVGIDRDILNVVVKMLKKDNTVPFIARYRRNRIPNLDVNKLRRIKEALDKSREIKQEAANVIEAIKKVGKCTPEIKTIVRSSKSLNCLKQIRTLYGENRSSAERARELGLDPLAQSIIEGGASQQEMRKYLKVEEKCLDEKKMLNEVQKGVVCILADMIIKNELVLDKTQKLRKDSVLHIQTNKIGIPENSDENSVSEYSEENESEKEVYKYDNYYNFGKSEKRIQPYEVLAINRAESKKIISVDLILPDYFEESLLRFVLQLFPAAAGKKFNRGFLFEAFRLAFEESIRPTILKSARSEITEIAEDAAIENFAENAKQLLLCRPVKGKVILGIDPGYEHGCKLALISPQSEVLATCKIFPHQDNGKCRREAQEMISLIIKKFECETIALGNGTGSRKTEAFISELIKTGTFAPLCVTYDIVDESGTSVYSCGPEAVAEFPDGLDCTLRSAVSIARRLQDPLAEYVKVDPKSLGIGMYQHDLPEHKLTSKWNQVIMEVVSFSGVDVNTASQSLLRRVAGLSEENAANIIKYRKENGPFLNRHMLRNVKGIDSKIFEQCAGFIRIMPQDSGSISLDQTSIHPDSYKLARDIIKACKVDLKDLETQGFISAVNTFAVQGLTVLAKRFQTNPKILEVIFEGLTMRQDVNIRVVDNTPIFSQSLRSIKDLSVGHTLSGIVRNIAHFGVFVDIGLEINGFMPARNFNRYALKIGQKLDVRIEKLMKKHNRIGLKLIKAY